MKHFHDITILTTHTPSNLATFDLRVDTGLITWCGIYFPPGCHGLVYGKAYFQTHQILPRGQEDWCHGNGGWWGGDMYFPVTAQPLNIKFEGFADNTLFDHKLTLGLELMPFEMVPAWNTLLSKLDGIGSLLGV